MPKTHENVRGFEKRVRDLFVAATVGAVAMTGSGCAPEAPETRPSPSASAPSDPTPEATPTVTASPEVTDTPTPETPTESPTNEPTAPESSGSAEPGPADTEKVYFGGELPPNAVSYEELEEKFANLTVADVDRMIEQEDIRSMATYLAMWYQRYLTSSASSYDTGKTSDCNIDEFSPENPINQSAASLTDPKEVACSILGVDNIISTVTAEPFISSDSAIIDRERAEIVAKLAYGFSASKDAYSKMRLDKALSNIHDPRAEHPYMIDYGDTAKDAEIVRRGTMMLDGEEVAYVDMILPSRDGFQSREERFVYVPLDQPIVRETPLYEQQPWSGWLDPETYPEDAEYGEMKYMFDKEGNAYPVVPEDMAAEKNDKVYVQTTIPYSIGLVSLYGDDVRLGHK